MSDTSQNPIFVFACDSRGNNFDKYPQSENFNVQYIIRRGYAIQQLELETLHFLNSLSIPPGTPVIIKIAAGINDILNSISSSQPFNADSILLKLEKFRSNLLSVIPCALVSFVTIPTVEVCLLPRLVNCPIPNLQSVVNDTINLLNSKIRSSNSKAGCWTVSWHLLVQKKVTKRSGKGRKGKIVYRYIYKSLYDGLHGSSFTKKKWFQMLISSFKGESSYARREPTSITNQFEDIVSSEHDSDYGIGSDSDSSSSLDLNSSSESKCDSIYVPWKRR